MTKTLHQCRVCKDMLPFTSFYVTATNGRSTSCKACDNARRTETSRELRQKRVRFIELAREWIPSWVPRLTKEQKRQAKELLGMWE